MPPGKAYLLVWEPEGWREYVSWQETDPKMVGRINELIRDILRHPFEGIGKPEPLRNQLKGQWSRRITQEHRLVYRVENSSDQPRLIILQCRFHY
ncbi:Txe/YoeB family addiction module toxin [Neorhizobium sp. BETTINA12A]|uniref:Txe/YoeB family addiction module toxin n=1 Tax=Neorhizobium sp. BETTINA12A TaxID=2908924 RepID=UPI001FF375A3|nr:Txe/YoeB family addiction module toxin [Neorhizobium sp. BETTINA12A]MCJ9752036.1 Txe/YoeB family addiction module toxin [Neorhizobium sp. BETTINA12A]